MFKGNALWLSLLAFLLPSFAWAEAPAPGPSPIGQFLFLGGFVLLFYFLLWRPQSKRAKEHKNLLSSLSKGDEIVTNGGVLGKITKLTDDFVVLEISEGVEVKLQRMAVASALPKGTIKGI